MKTERIHVIDGLYTIGCLLVLIGHSHSSDWSTFSGSILERAVVFIYTFHMPLFFFVAGFLFQNSTSLKRQGYVAWLLKKSLKLLTPYFILSLVGLLPKIYIEYGSFEGLTADAVLNVLFIPRNGAWGHLWFLPTLWTAYALFGGFRTLLKSLDEKKFIIGSFAATIVFYFCAPKTNLLCLHDLSDLMVWFPVGMAGNYIKKNKTEEIPKWGGSSILLKSSLCVGCIIVVWMLTYKAHSNRIIGLCAALIMIFACHVPADIIGKTHPGRWLSENSLTVYIYSWLFQAAIMYLCDRFGLHWAVTFALMFFAGLTGPVTLILIYQKMPFLHNRFFDLLLGIKAI